jgi:nucleoside-diphosphate-sugar epimerase
MAWTDPQPAIVWASSSSVYGLNTKVPFSEKDRTDQPASLYAATKKAGEEIAHLQSYLRTFPYWVAIFYGLWTLGKAGYGIFLFYQGYFEREEYSDF